jgi:hypothetical protein
MSELAEVQIISIYPQDKLLIKRIGDELGLNSISATVRFVLRDWAKSHNYNGNDEVNGE